MVRIGLIGEDENDTSAFAHLMKQKYDAGYSYRALSKSKFGSQLFNPAAIRSYNFEIKKKTFDFIVVVIDADAVANETEKIRKKEELYTKLKRELTCDSILLLNVYELEALILADLETFNKEYKANVTYVGHVSHKDDPKGYLRQKTEKGHRKYEVSDCPDLFKKIRFDVVSTNCSYFNSFVQQFEEAVANKS